MTRQDVRDFDSRAERELGLPTLVLMENAGRAVAEQAMEMLGPGGRSVLVVCGGGNNAGDGYVAARHLHVAGHKVVVLAVKDVALLTGDTAVMAQACQKLGISFVQVRTTSIDLHVDLIIDALFGIGLTSAPRDFMARAIDAINDNGAPVLAVDLPSGLDCDTGTPLGPCVSAVCTVTFVAEKAGFENPISRAFTGQIVVAPIGVPTPTS